MGKPNRYLLEPLPGLEGHAGAKHWGPAARASPEVEQGWLPFSDGSQLGPLFDAGQQLQGEAPPQPPGAPAEAAS
jgi:hypothetical protein